MVFVLVSLRGDVMDDQKLCAGALCVGLAVSLPFVTSEVSLLLAVLCGLVGSFGLALIWTGFAS